MLGDRKVSAVVCSTDLARSQEFYEQQVGLKLSPETFTNHLVFECGDGTTLLVYGRPSPNMAEHTQVGFWTSEIEADVRELAERGLTFEEFDSPKTVDHVATFVGIAKAAFFKDPDGNRIALFQPE